MPTDIEFGDTWQITHLSGDASAAGGAIKLGNGGRVDLLNSDFEKVCVQIKDIKERTLVNTGGLDDNWTSGNINGELGKGQSFSVEHTEEPETNLYIIHS